MTTRQFNLTGYLSAEDVTAIITIDDVEVFNGTLTGALNTSEVVIAAGSFDAIDPVDGSDIVKSASVTITHGAVNVGMFRWNYGQIRNPAYTDAQLAIVNNSASTSEQIFEVFKAVANPPFSSADLDIFASTDPADNPIKYALFYEHKCFPTIQDPLSFSYGASSTDIDCNRFNALLNGTPVDSEPLYYAINMQAGDVLTFDNNIFASNINEQYPGGWTL